MARHSRLEVLTAMKRTGLVPVFYNSDFETAKNIVAACADGGAECVEFTNRGDRAVNIFTKIAEYRDKERPDIILGIGSICDAPTAAMYISAGTDFVVGPMLDEDTARLCNSRKILNKNALLFCQHLYVTPANINFFVFPGTHD